MRDETSHPDAAEGYGPRDEWLLAAPRNRPDRWAHRRGEPRGFALLWSCYLLAACILALFRPASRWSFDPQQVRSSCVLLLALILLGFAVFWPLVRLSQARPRVPSRAAAVDLLIVLGPTAAVLAPMGFLTRWSGATVVALALATFSWGMLFGGAMAAFGRASGTASRALAMGACLALAGAGPLTGLLLASLAAGSGDAPDPAAWRATLLVSPVSAPYAIVGFPSVRTPQPDSLAWRLAVAPLLPASLLWLAGVVMDLIASPAPGRAPGTDSASAGPRRAKAGYH
jgi:hypothetical protein